MVRYKMKKLAIIFFFVAEIAYAGCSRHDEGRAVLDLAMNDIHIESVRDLKHSASGLREQVDELFFRANPAELKEAVAKAGFARDDSIPAQIRNSTSHFRELIGSADQSNAVGFRRIDLGVEDGKYCEMLCAPDFSWAYLIYVDYGKS